MKKAIGVLSFVLVVSLSLRSQQQSGKDLSWAFPVKNGDLPPEDASPKTVPGSTKTYPQVQIEDLSNPPDWFPNEHAPAPQIVQHGHDDALACGACHFNVRSRPSRVGGYGWNEGRIHPTADGGFQERHTRREEPYEQDRRGTLRR